uniref:Protein photinus pyralis n=1 Tax=Xenopsylla cheopis TaxID=163159 RepID=A0A6M2DST3_XENCH
MSTDIVQSAQVDLKKSYSCCETKSSPSIGVCKNCGKIYHVSYGNRKGFKFLIGNLIECCVVNSDVKSGHMEIVIAKLEDTINDKNTIIDDKVIIIKHLEEKIKFLEEKQVNRKVADAIGAHSTNDSKNKKKEKIFQNQETEKCSTNLKYLAERSSAIFKKSIASTATTLNSLNKENINEQNINEINENWTLVQKRKKAKRKTKYIEGTNTSTLITGVTKYSYLHVFKLAPSTSAEGLTKYLNEKGFKNIICEKMQSKLPEVYASFKVAVEKSDMINVKAPEIWPKGVCINKFLFQLEKKIINKLPNC